MSFKYVYLLKSIAEQDRYYVGLTEDLQVRLAKHNAGAVPSTASAAPWEIDVAVAFRDGDKAIQF